MKDNVCEEPKTGRFFVGVSVDTTTTKLCHCAQEQIQKRVYSVRLNDNGQG